MITLTEYVESEKWVNEIDEEVIAMAEGYTIGYDQKTFKTVIRLFDAADEKIIEGRFDNSEMAIAMLEEYFDLDESDQSWNDSYEWVNAGQKLDEALEPIVKYIERNADEYQVRIDDIDNDAMFDDLFGVEVFFHSSNNRDDLSSFVKEISYDMLRNYGAQSYNFDGQSWKISL